MSPPLSSLTPPPLNNGDIEETQTSCEAQKNTSAAKGSCAMESDEAGSPKRFDAASHLEAKARDSPSPTTQGSDTTQKFVPKISLPSDELQVNNPPPSSMVAGYNRSGHYLNFSLFTAFRP